jgi:hypothetical protein
MKYTINELANSKGVSQPVREALLQMADYKQLYEQVCEQYDVLAKELDATNRQVEILSDALAESRREVAALKAVQEPEYVYTCNGCDTLYREDDVSCDCTVHGLMEFTRHILAPDTTPPAQPAPVQEPVADVYMAGNMKTNIGTNGRVVYVSTVYSEKPLVKGDKLYTTPPAAPEKGNTP